MGREEAQDTGSVPMPWHSLGDARGAVEWWGVAAWVLSVGRECRLGVSSHEAELAVLRRGKS